MAKKKRASQSFSEREVEWLADVLRYVQDPYEHRDSYLQGCAEEPQCGSVYRKVLSMQKKLEG